jgi:hypothetical protein
MALSGWTTGTSGGLGNNTLRLIPFYVSQPTCIDRIGTEVTVAGEAGSVVRLGIFDDAGGLPGSPVIDATVSAAAIGTPEATVFTVLMPGWYWVGGVVQGAPTTQPTLRTAASSPTQEYPIIADTAATIIQNVHVGQAKGGVSGALAAFGTTLSTTSLAPRVFVRLN